MARLFIDFEQEIDRDGYELATLKWRKRKQRVVRRKGGQLDRRRPLEFHPALFAQFAELDGTPESFVTFANTFGPLTAAGNQSGDLVGGWTDALENMRYLVGLWRKDPARVLYRGAPPLSYLVAELRPGPQERPALAVSPPDLHQALRLQFAQAVASDADLRRCEWCGTWFEVGTGGRRADARFCSDPCKTKYHNDAKAQRRKR